ncbi:AMP-binding protein [Naumannella sp. ID2617S]|nr:AMP-binding protein [Naumannella sp. ID2617S]
MDGTESYAAGPTEPALLEQTIGANLAATVAAHPDRDALVEFWTGRRWTYAELADEVERVARGLLSRGLTVGDRVGIWSPNCAEWVLLQYATARLGVILVNINPAYRTHELAYALNQSECTMLVAARAYKTSAYAEMVAQVSANLPFLKQVVLFGEPGDGTAALPEGYAPAGKEALSWADLLAAGESVPAERAQEVERGLSADDPINIQYTSGTTGFPKGATLSHRNILNNGFLVGEGIRLTAEDRLVYPVPLYHCFGMVMSSLACVSHGATQVLPAPTFDATSCLQAVQAERATVLHGVPTMFIAEQNLPDFDSYDLSTLRTGIMAGSPCPVEVMKKCLTQMNMAEVGICYGMTETSPVSTQTMPDDDVEHRCGTVGRVHPHVEVKVINPVDGKTLPRGETGEFCTRGYSVMLGYWNEPEKTAEAIDADGWMHTGDLAVMNLDGYLNIVGRIKDLVIRGGENIYPREIEEFLHQHPDITDVQVVGVPDKKYGEELCAFVITRDGKQLDAAEVAAFAEGKLARYKIPRYVMVVEEFPMTVTGKVRKVEMRSTAAQLLGL